jgi:hypothetical protein
VTRGHLLNEFIDAGLLADIYAASGEGGRGAALYVRTGQADKLTELLERLGDRYVDLTRYVDSPAPWQRYAAYKAIVAQADLIQDDQVEQLIGRAFSDVTAGLTASIRQGPFLLVPQVEFAALDAVASLIERGPAAQVRSVLETLEPLVPREPNTYKHTDKGHVRTLAAVLDRNDDFGPVAAKQLLDMLALNESVSQEVLQIADSAIARRVELFKDQLPKLIETSFTAAWLLGQLNLTPPPGSQVVRRAFETLTAPYQEAPGVFGMGLPLARNAQLVRHLSQEECETAARAQLARARDHGQPAVNRSTALDAVRVLSSSVSAEMRKELFEASITFARGLEDGSALDDMAGPAHPLSHFKISLGMASLAVPGIQLAAATASDAVSAELVERTAIPLLNQPSREITNGTAFALSWLGDHPAALPPAALAIHGDPSVRSLAAVRWVRQNPRDEQIGLGLASDPDFHVRISLANLISAMDHLDESVATVYAKLSHDPRYSVRRAATRCSSDS